MTIKLLIILYCSFVSFTYLYSPTNASFSDKETVTGTITVGHWETECKDLKAKGEEQHAKSNNDKACGKEKEEKDKKKEPLSPSDQKANEGTTVEKEKEKPDTKKEEIKEPEVPKKPENPQKQPEKQPKENAEKPADKTDGEVQQNQPETESEDTAASAADQSLQSSDQ